MTAHRAVATTLGAIRAMGLRRRAAFVRRAELNPLCERQLTRKIDRVRLTPHVVLPAIAAALAAAAGLFFAAERSPDLCTARARIYVGDSAIAPDRAHEFFRFAHVISENR